ncbi:MAG: F0F1 ATP synthase subunit A [Parachlamydiales bacterium]|jgi:F-type H+-transporting ATPase subunit a
MKINPDEIIFFSFYFIKINATILFTWLVMIFLVLMFGIVTRKLKVEKNISRWQLFLEALTEYVQNEIKQITNQKKGIYLYFLGSLFLFISMSNLLVIIPGYFPPTSSFSTTLGLAICVFLAVPIFGIKERGIKNYLKHYIDPSILMLPFHLMGELSRTFALAVRLFGNIMSGVLVVGVLLSIAPFFFPILLQLLGLLIGQIQAYIFSVLAAVYIAGGMEATNN